MSLSPGARLGPYEILAPLGAGGMGEVYRARDTRLERTVAIKVLPSRLSSSPEVRQRFEREAKTISQLSHPHICALYDVGREGETEYLVMEYLEGETLSDRLAKGSLPLEQTLRFGVEIADALDKAHRQGIVHRDLKPGNVMLTRSGVKLLDFGLAKLREADASPPFSRLSALPTQEKSLTAEGTIVGTLQYMAPEQLEGKEADARTDVFAFGATLYEMATGKQAFTGANRASLITAIMSSEPAPISAIQPMAPPALDRLVKTCLARDPEDRWQSAHDIVAELRWIAEGSQAGVPAPVASRRRSRDRLAWGLVAALALAAAGLVWALLRRSPEPAASLRFSIAAPEKTSFRNSFAISPDGRWLAFVSADATGRSLLWVRPMDSLVARAIPDTDDARYPFWSPDSRHLAFFARGKLVRIDPAGGPPQALCDSDDPRGGAWGANGVILVANGVRGPLMRVSAAGGVPAPLTALDPGLGDYSHRWPRFLPDGRHFVFFSRSVKPEGAGIFVASLDAPKPRRVLESPGRPDYGSGYLLFVREKTLLAQPFDASRLALSGEPFQVAVGVMAEGEAGFTGYAPFSVSAAGLLAYMAVSPPKTRLTWMDRTGRTIGTVGDAGLWAEPWLFADGRHLAVETEDPKTGAFDIWVVDLPRGAFSRLTFNTGSMGSDAWAAASPDGTWVAYSSIRGGPADLYRKQASGAGAEELLLHTNEVKWLDAWTPDGRYLVFDNVSQKTKFDVWALPLFGDRKPFPVVQTPFNDAHGAVSPDMRWIAYASDQTGRPEIYVQPFPGGGGRWQLSTTGGDQPLWRSDGRELYFLAADSKLMTVQIKAGSTFEARLPVALFELRVPPNAITDLRNQYVAAADGQRFLVAAPVEDPNPPPIIVVSNWSEQAK